MTRYISSIACAILFAFAFSAQSQNVGINTSTPGSTLHIEGSFAAKYNSISSSSYTLLSTDHFVQYSGNSNGTFTLPAAIVGTGNFKGREYVIKNYSSYSLTVAANGSELIDGSSSVTVVAFGFLHIISNGSSGSTTTWNVIANTTSAFTKQIFTYTGGGQAFIVPPGVTSISVKLWGGGGGPGWGTGYSPGGPGGYVSGTLTVTPGENLLINIGAGGTNYSYGGNYYFGGGADGGYYYAGGGGGMTSIQTFSGTYLVICGGGGGAGEYYNTTLAYGGGGGGSTGETGSSVTTGAGGGSQTAGGTGGTGTGGNGSTGIQYYGGIGSTASPTYAGGGGGGGYYGGGGGGAGSNGTKKSGGGGGGSSYVGGLSGTVANTQGTHGSSGTVSTLPPNSSDTDYITGIGIGGYTDTVNNIVYPGGDGEVVISW